MQQRLLLAPRYDNQSVILIQWFKNIQGCRTGELIDGCAFATTVIHKFMESNMNDFAIIQGLHMLKLAHLSVGILAKTIRRLLTLLSSGSL